MFEGPIQSAQILVKAHHEAKKCCDWKKPARISTGK